jgi:prephenate dehydrogenase
MVFQKITLIGVGLLGGSLGLAVKRKGLAGEVGGFVRRAASIAECLNLGVVDHATQDLRQAVENADLVVLCTPISRMRGLVEQMTPALKQGAVVTDVGSVKGSVTGELEPIVTRCGAYFVGSHPMAGAERIGVLAAQADLFEGCYCVVTPTPNSNADAVDKVEFFWECLGARVLRLSPGVHDELVSRSSHLPHVVAAELTNYVLSPSHPKEQALVCASGFRDTTRIASGSPEMWKDIALGNRSNLSRALRAFIDDLEEFQIALENRDETAILEFFEKAKGRRDHWVGRDEISCRETV